MTPAEKFESLPEWLRITYFKNGYIYAFVERFLRSDLPMESLFEKLAESLIEANEQLTRNFENYVANNAPVSAAAAETSPDTKNP